MFNGFDVITALVIIFFCFVGYKTGIIATFLYIASGFIGIYAAKNFSAQLGINFYLLFLLTCVSIIVIGSVVAHMLRNVFLGVFDHILGMVLGVLLGITAMAIVMFPVMDSLSWQNQVKVVTSFSGRNIIPWVQKLLPPMKELSLKNIKEAIEEQERLARELEDEYTGQITDKAKKAVKERLK